MIIFIPILKIFCILIEAIKFNDLIFIISLLSVLILCTFVFQTVIANSPIDDKLYSDVLRVETP